MCLIFGICPLRASDAGLSFCTHMCIFRTLQSRWAIYCTINVLIKIVLHIDLCVDHVSEISPLDVPLLIQLYCISESLRTQL